MTGEDQSNWFTAGLFVVDNKIYISYYHDDGKEDVMTATKPGARFRCAQCGTEVVVVKPSGDGPRCCSAEMENLSSPATAR
jgi:hypothetical protein